MSLKRIIDLCEKEKTDLLLIAGDLFHRQPLLRELKEVDSLFASLTKTQVVLAAGNHDHLKKNSYYNTFSWGKHVHMILTEELSAVELPEIGTAVYSFSYKEKEMREKPYAGKRAKGLCPTEILMVHGGDELHVPLNKEEMLELGYDYIALGHIHKPQSLVPGRMAFSGALEPVDKNDVGAHGYISGEIKGGKCRVEFIPFAKREYIHALIEVTGDMTGSRLKEKIREMIEQRGTENIYKILLTGYRDPDILFDLRAMDVYGNIIEIFDDTKPSYDFEKIKNQNKDNILGKLIGQLEGYDEKDIRHRAMCEGVRALMETRRG